MEFCDGDGCMVWDFTPFQLYFSHKKSCVQWNPIDGEEVYHLKIPFLMNGKSFRGDKSSLVQEDQLLLQKIVHSS